MLVPLNFRLARAEHEDILAHADASMFIVEPDFHESAAAIRQPLPLMRLVALRGDARRLVRVGRPGADRVRAEAAPAPTPTRC